MYAWQYLLESQYEKKKELVPFLFDDECHSFPPPFFGILILFVKAHSSSLILLFWQLERVKK